MAEVSKEVIDKALEAIEVAKASGKIKKGANEVTKAIERGVAKIVAYAKDVTPPEVVMHLPLLAKEKGIICIEVPSREELGASAGIDVPTASVAVTQEGEAKAIIKEIAAKVGTPTKSDSTPKPEAPKAEAKEKPAEEKKEAPKKEAKPKKK